MCRKHVGKLLDFPSNGTVSGASVDILPRADDTALHVEFGASGDLGCRNNPSQSSFHCWGFYH